MVDRENLYYKTNEYTYDFQNLRRINTLATDIYNGTLTLKEADNDQSDLLIEILNFRKQVKQKYPEKNQQKEDVLRERVNRIEKGFLMPLIEKYF